MAPNNMKMSKTALMKTTLDPLRCRRRNERAHLRMSLGYSLHLHQNPMIRRYSALPTHTDDVHPLPPSPRPHPLPPPRPPHLPSSTSVTSRPFVREPGSVVHPSPSSTCGEDYGTACLAKAGPWGMVFDGITIDERSAEGRVEEGHRVEETMRRQRQRLRRRSTSSKRFMRETLQEPQKTW